MGKEKLSSGKQIAIGVFTFIAFWFATTLAVGEIAFIDTIYIMGESPVLHSIFIILYFIVMIIFGVLAKKKGLKTLMNTSIAVSIMPAVDGFIALIGSFLSEPTNDNAIDQLLTLFYPLLPIAYPFATANRFCSVLFVISPLAAYIAYKVAKRPQKTEVNSENA